VHVRVRGTGKEAMKVKGPLPKACRSAGRLLLLQDAQASISEKSLEGLVTDTRRYNLAGFTEETIITVGRKGT
jgi:hypothetical protein